jgi:hypothetical protein
VTDDDHRSDPPDETEGARTEPEPPAGEPEGTVVDTTPEYARLDLGDEDRAEAPDFNVAYDAHDKAIVAESKALPWPRRVVHSLPYYCIVMAILPLLSWRLVLASDSPVITGFAIASTAFALLVVLLRVRRGSVLSRFIRVRERIRLDAELADPVTGRLVGVKASYRVAQHLWDDEVLLWETEQHGLSIPGKAFRRLRKLFSTTFRKILTGTAAFGVFFAISNNPVLGIAIVVALVGGFIAYSIGDWSADRYALTDQRVMAVLGLITERQPAMPRARITDINGIVSVTAKFLAWLSFIELPYGTLVFESAGQDQALREVEYVPCALAVSAALKMAKIPG